MCPGPPSDNSIVPSTSEHAASQSHQTAKEGNKRKLFQLKRTFQINQCTSVPFGINSAGFHILRQKNGFTCLNTSATGAFRRRLFICIHRSSLSKTVQNICILRTPPGSMMNVSQIKCLDHDHHFGGSGKEDVVLNV